ncbi:MAG: hypothetical protein KGL74_10675, partial [Elusimicrobia bacterium]|nr:hypothetical protein [Elusimicrobiota bacterium]
MITFHAEFLRGRLFVWGETADAKGAEPETLAEALRAAGLARPLHLDALPAGSAPAVTLETAEAVDFLASGASRSAASHHAVVGPDLASWIAALEFCASLVVRERVVQGYALEDGRFQAYWTPICTGTDEQSFKDLSARLPGDAFPEFLREFAGHLMRRGPKTASRPAPAAPAPAGGPFKLCFRLEEPEELKDGWRVNCLLQSTSDPSLLLPPSLSLGAGAGAPKILRREHCEFREKLIGALDHAARICPVVRRGFESPGLDGFDLDAHEAHEFLTHFAGPLEAAGFGVLLPAWWTRKGGRPRL